MKKLRFFKRLMLFLTFVSIIFLLYNAVYLIGYRKSYSPFCCHSYIYYSEEESCSIFGVNNLEFDKNGNIYVGCADGIIIFDNEGTPLQHIFIEDEYLFKIEENMLKIISPNAFSLRKNLKKEGVYLFEIQIYVDSELIVADFVKSGCFEEDFLDIEYVKVDTDLSFDKYALENGYALSLACEYNGEEYRYGFYGDIFENHQKVIELSTIVFPVAEEMPGKIVLFFFTSFVLLQLFELCYKKVR